MCRDEKKSAKSEKSYEIQDPSTESSKSEKTHFLWKILHFFGYITSTFLVEKKRWKNVWKLCDILLFSEMKIISSQKKKKNFLVYLKSDIFVLLIKRLICSNRKKQMFRGKNNGNRNERLFHNLFVQSCFNSKNHENSSS